MKAPDLDLNTIPSPCFVVDEDLLLQNMQKIKNVQNESGGSIICALKGFATYSTFRIINPFLTGTTASSLNEAILGSEEMKGDVHVYSPAFIPDEFTQILNYASHITFNSFNEFHRYKEEVAQHSRKISCGIRINPEYSEVEKDIYNPCVPGSRLGVTAKDFENQDLSGIEGFHFHTHCENNSDTLERTVQKVEEKFGKYLHDLKWLNFGGGHHITSPDYDVDKLIHIIKHFKSTYDLKVILEPGTAIGLNTGYLVCTVLDIVNNPYPIAILDTSASAHMPDCLEVPYQPDIHGATKLPLGEGDTSNPYFMRLAGSTCLAGDIIGDYLFDQPPGVGDKLIIMDMIHYTMVKTTMFNGIKHPSIGIWRSDKSFDLVKEFGYQDYKSRL